MPSEDEQWQTRALAELRSEWGQPQRKVLLVLEDNEDDARELVNLLAKPKYPVDPVWKQTAEDALKEVQATDFTLCFVALKLAGMGGLAFIQAARAIKSALRFVLVAPYAGNEEAMAAVRAGVMIVLAKPVTEADLDQLFGIVRI